MSIALHIAKGCGPTGELLAGLLQKQGVTVSHTATSHVCWGVGIKTDLPTLNRNVSRTKLTELETLRKAGVPTIPYTTGMPVDFPVLARLPQHHGGRDIRVCLDQGDVRRCKAKGYAFFSLYVPRQTEYRVWIYRRQHLGTYEKVLKYPNKLRGVGCNYDNGYAFTLVPSAQIERAAVEVAAKAVEALQLDFGAVDILVGRQHKYYVLEVNTAPGVEGEGRQVIQALAQKVANWEKLKYPPRHGDVAGGWKERKKK